MTVSGRDATRDHFIDLRLIEVCGLPGVAAAVTSLFRGMAGAGIVAMEHYALLYHYE